jgi:hypothetical protein
MPAVFSDPYSSDGFANHFAVGVNASIELRDDRSVNVPVEGRIGCPQHPLQMSVGTSTSGT